MTAESSSGILIVSSAHGKGWGAEEVLEHYLRAGADVSVAAPSDSRFPDVLRETGQPFFPLPTCRNTVHQNILAALRMPRPPNVQLVHAWCARSVESAFFLSRRLGAGLTVGLHDSPDQHYHSSGRKLLVKNICRRARAVATVSEAMAEKCRILGLSDQPYIALNGIPEMEMPRLEPKSPRPPTVGFLGMNAARKGFHTVADWIEGSECLWRLYGDMDPVIEDEANALLRRHPDRVTYCGRQPVCEIYGQVDVVVMPSVEFEPFGLVAVEAGRAGLPVVASEVGGLCEIIEHGQSGFLYPEHRPETGLDFIKNLCGDAELSKTLGVRGREIFEKKFTLPPMKKAWDAFFQENLK